MSVLGKVPVGKLWAWIQNLAAGPTQRAHIAFLTDRNTQLTEQLVAADRKATDLTRRVEELQAEVDVLKVQLQDCQEKAKGPADAGPAVLIAPTGGGRLKGF